MSPWLYLLLAHLIADFVLQPFELVQLKRRPVGLIIHTSIHALVTAALAAPILTRWWLVIPLLSFVHYWIDALKVAYGPARGPWSLVAFVVDQAVHLGTLALAVLLAGVPLAADRVFVTPALTAVFYYAVPYVAAVFAGAILIYQVALAFQTRAQPETLLSPGPRTAGMVERLVTLTVVLFLAPWWWWLGAVTAALQWGANQRQPRRWLETATALGFPAVLGLLFR